MVERKVLFLLFVAVLLFFFNVPQRKGEKTRSTGEEVPSGMLWRMSRMISGKQLS